MYWAKFWAPGSLTPVSLDQSHLYIIVYVRLAFPRLTYVHKYVHSSTSVCLSCASYPAVKWTNTPFSVFHYQAHCENKESKVKALRYADGGPRTFCDLPFLRSSSHCPRSSMEDLSLFPSLTFIPKLPHNVPPN